MVENSLSLLRKEADLMRLMQELYSNKSLTQCRTVITEEWCTET